MPKSTQPSTATRRNGGPGTAVRTKDLVLDGGERLEIELLAERRTSEPSRRNKPRPQIPVSLRFRDSGPINLSVPDTEREALKRAYQVRNRRRWTSRSAPVGGDFQPEWIDGREETLEGIAKAGLVEIEIPSGAQWALRVMPWEFMLSAATARYREGRPLTVVRRLTSGRRAATTNGAVDRCLFVESAPGRLAEDWDLHTETELMRLSLARTGDHESVQVQTWTDPRQLAERITRFQPTLIHFAGLDTHQGAPLLGIKKLKRDGHADDPSASDGLILDDLSEPVRHTSAGSRSEKDRAVEQNYAVLARDVATLFATSRPSLVSLNVYNSAMRTAPMLVESGARYAIGFQDTIDDRIAEHFFALFYRRLAGSDNVPEAFRFSLDILREEKGRLRGACVVLWSAESVVADAPPAAVKPVPVEIHTLRKSPSVQEKMKVFCEPWKEINFSLLHNGRSPFVRFQVARGAVNGDIADIAISVTMHLGDAQFPFVKTLTMPATESLVDLTDDVVFPLTSDLLRSQSEKLRSALSVEIKVGSDVAHRETYPMTIAPVDEWQDTDEDRLWLPSFVLPRDPKVAEIVQSARNYLIGITDDPEAGFDGYQSENWRAVDDQVRALWYALVLDKPLLYTNPPPSYTNPGSEDFPQRLRTPSEIIRGGHGTCIDLALLLCACLEYIDIYSVIFLLEGHCFAGYWRMDRKHDEFEEKSFEAVESDQLRGGAERDRLEASYTVPRSAYLEIKTAIERGDLVPLEATFLTAQKSFKESRKAGIENLYDRREFQSMIDLTRAREEGIVPLPILGRSS
jgi:hypothetical protein